MKIIVVGAGVIGATTAYWLGHAGHDVDIVDAAGAPGEGVSAGNGGQLAYAYVDPLAGPDIWRSLPRILLGRDAAVRFRPALDPALMVWCLQFLWRCRRAALDAALDDLLSLAMESKRTLDWLLERENLDFGYRPAGKLILYRDQASMDGAARSIDRKRRHGCSLDVLDEAGCRALEPALDQYPHPIVGGIYAQWDAIGDCAQFTRQLIAAGAARFGIRFHPATAVTDLLGDRRRVRGIVANANAMPSDAVVLAAGPQSADLARQAGVTLPIYPVKGYSLDAPAGAIAPAISLTDCDARLLIARIGQRVRVAGYADIEGRSETKNAARAQSLGQAARRLFPNAARWDEAAATWMGRRPTTPDGRPRIGPSPAPGLFLNTGHGGLGWTLACGSAARLAEFFGPA